MGAIAELFLEILWDGLLFREHRWVWWGLVGVTIVIVAAIAWKLAG